MDISYHSSGEIASGFDTGKVSEMQKHPKSLEAFADLKYQDSLLSWVISVDNIIIDNLVQNLSDKLLILHWDQALLSSSHQPDDTLLRSYGSSVAGEVLGPKGYVPKNEDRLHKLIPLHLSPGQKANVDFNPKLTELFNSGRLFGVRYEPGKTTLIESGIGNWLLIKLPVDWGGQPLTMHIKLTALDAKARISYF
ncbi:hypothetical protein [Permianibacter aggregans]|nr:hypothetical protein [Permianibacter aggregans]QGX41118.1 hypothetical protein E2H98_16170 [Permianibacter aggregans]